MARDKGEIMPLFATAKIKAAETVKEWAKAASNKAAIPTKGAAITTATATVTTAITADSTTNKETSKETAVPDVLIARNFQECRTEKSNHRPRSNFSPVFR